VLQCNRDVIAENNSKDNDGDGIEGSLEPLHEINEKVETGHSTMTETFASTTSLTTCNKRKISDALKSSTVVVATPTTQTGPPARARYVSNELKCIERVINAPV